MVKKRDKLSALHPEFKKKMEELMAMMLDSVSLLYEEATHDEKTGLYNNKFFESILEMEIAKARRGQQSLSLVITDIDLFKKINDTYGHMKADELLARLAKVVMKVVRVSDIAARFGGEEFVILLPETNLEKAEKFASRLKRAIHRDSMLKKFGVRVSGGITEFRGVNGAKGKGKGDSRKNFLVRADKGLYAAKEGGRDRFVSVK